MTSSNYQLISRTHIGKKRTLNEDCLEIIDALNIAVVADGVGGNQYGEVASQIAVDSVTQNIQENSSELVGKKAVKTLANAVRFANEQIITIQQNEPSHEDMCTTVCCFHLENNTLSYSWVGDSRIYRIQPSKNTIIQLTKDHTLDPSKIDAKVNPSLHQRASSILTQVVGSIMFLKPDIGSSTTDKGDIILACTDGLTDLVPDNLILEYCQKFEGELDGLADKLLDRALDCGGFDNISFVIATCNS